MAHKNLVGGTAYDTKGGKCLVSGTAYDVKKGRTLVGGTGYDVGFAPAIDPVFANNTWAAIIYACQSGQVPDTWAVGDSKSMTIGGVDYNIDIIGKNHDVYADGSGTAPLTFQMHEVYDYAGTMEHSWGDSYEYSYWEYSVARVDALPALLSNMPNEVQAGVREVSKEHSVWSPYISTVSIGSKNTSDKLFLLSEVEVYRGVWINYSVDGEGTQYEYYAADSSRRVKTTNAGTTVSWWTRSLNRSGEGNSYVAYDASGNAGTSVAWSSKFFAPAFCF